jgi:hypothetical protein
MRLTLIAVLVLHGLVHLLGVAKAFGLAALPQLTEPIATDRGWLWLMAAVLFVAAAVGVVMTRRRSWCPPGPSPARGTTRRPAPS